MKKFLKNTIFTSIVLSAILIIALIFAVLPDGADLISEKGDHILGQVLVRLLELSVMVDIGIYLYRKSKK